MLKYPTRDIYSAVKIIIEGDDYRKHNIKKKINVKNSEEFSKSFLTNQIEFGLNESFNDSLRSKTIQNLNNLIYSHSFYCL